MVIAGKEQYPCPCSFTVPRQIKQKRQTFNYFWNWTSCYWYMFFIYMQKLIALYYYRINEWMVITCVVSIIVFIIVDNNCSIDYLKMMIQLCSLICFSYAWSAIIPPEPPYGKSSEESYLALQQRWISCWTNNGYDFHYLLYEDYLHLLSGCSLRYEVFQADLNFIFKLTHFINLSRMKSFFNCFYSKSTRTALILSTS